MLWEFYLIELPFATRYIGTIGLLLQRNSISLSSPSDGTSAKMSKPVTVAEWKNKM